MRQFVLISFITCCLVVALTGRFQGESQEFDRGDKKNPNVNSNPEELERNKEKCQTDKKKCVATLFESDVERETDKFVHSKSMRKFSPEISDNKSNAKSKVEERNRNRRHGTKMRNLPKGEQDYGFKDKVNIDDKTRGHQNETVMRNFQSYVHGNQTQVEKKRVKRGETSRRYNKICSVLDCELMGVLKFPTCHCDSACNVYNDCCPLDYFTSNMSMTPHFNKHERYAGYMSCDKSFISLYVSHAVGYWTIDKCPASYADNWISSSCNGSDTLTLPVTDDFGFVYRNAFCAICHSIDSYTTWSIEFPYEECPGNYSPMKLNQSDITTLLKSQTSNNDCQIIYSFPRSKPVPRMCSDVYKETDDDYCRSFMNPGVYEASGKHEFYRNVYCASESLNNDIRCVFNMEYVSSVSPHSMFDTTILFQFPGITVKEDMVKCGPAFQYNPDLGICVPAACEETGHSANCEAGIYVNNYKFALDIDGSAQSHNAIDDMFPFRAVLVLFSTMHFNMSIKQIYMTLKCMSNDNWLDSRIDCQLPVCCKYHLQALIRTENKSIMLSEMKTWHNGLQELTWSYLEDNISSGETVSGSFRNLKLIDDTVTAFVPVLTESSAGTNTEDRDIELLLEEYEVKEMMNKILQKKRIGMHDISDTPLHLHVSSTAYFTVENGQLQLWSLAVYEFSFEQRMRKQNEKSASQTPTSNRLDAIDVATCVAGIMSLTSLIGMIILNRYVNSTFLGTEKILEHFATLLILNHITALGRIFLSHIALFCKVVGAFMHCMWISILTWLIILSYEILIYVHQKKNAPVKTKIPWHYHALVYLPALLIVCPCVAVDLTGYAIPFCFPSMQWESMAVFFGPGIMILLVVSVANIAIRLRLWRIKGPIRLSTKRQITVLAISCPALCCYWMAGLVAIVTNNVFVMRICILLLEATGFTVSVTYVSVYRVCTSLGRREKKACTSSEDDHQNSEVKQ